ncbi:MAG: addA [Gammaproteobacteria bacterium]|jgi:ATP-dependent exoDNAse (exonuclease V) beta subunit|nr:addA [Gammaproteobacteria bacterium]
MNNIPDQQQRQEALDPKKSFIVQAPAGSGKTELLIQRFLVLLNQVKQPEEILAITFTKKSSAEMRTRIINALIKANQTPEPPEATHAQTTWKLAKAALKHAQALNWNLLENPNRLRIQTIDSFNIYLTKQLPILSNFGAPPEIIDDPSTLYQAAVQESLRYLEENTAWSTAIAKLLLHIDNDLNKVQMLLINLLKKRDQWLPYLILNTTEPELRKKLENHLADITIDALVNLKTSFPPEHHGELIYLANFAAHHLLKENNTSPITQCANLTTLPETTVKDKKIWLGIIELLFTKENQWRKQFNKNIGFPSVTASNNQEEKILFDSVKKRISSLIDMLQRNTEILPAAIECRLVPDCRYEEKQWQMLDALHQVLRLVIAQLKLVFQRHGKIDYIESAQAALTALGTEDAPTDMILALDYQIQHILIDEFQDTSNTQYRLIEKLTSGWTLSDGRTLFVVGDPMQSIYRFREAEVGYFIRARHAGLNHIHLKPLLLSGNFRSTPGIVDWVNYHFQQILPAFEDISTGAVSYSPSVATHLAIETLPVELHNFINASEFAQAENIVQLIQQLKQQNPYETIAILVRSRTHLATIIPALKKAQLSYKAIDIDPLTTRPVIQDLMALTRALLHPADRIAWLAILRAPWCGLLLSDLLILTNENASNTLWEQLQKADLIEKLSMESQQRIHRIFPILQSKIADRHRFPLRLWIKSTWLLLGGPACTEHASDLDDAASYFKLLEKLDNSGNLANLDTLEYHVSRLYAAPHTHADDSLQIMTIHNAKGLEFDTVILPYLERKTPQDDKALLLWMERPRPHTYNTLLIAPIHATGQKNDSIYEYIKKQHALKNHYENGRLLYVATTRAKKRLHLFFSLQKEKDKISNPEQGSLLHQLWYSLAAEILHKSSSPFHTIHEYEHTPFSTLSPPKEKRSIQRLRLDWSNPLKEYQVQNIFTFHNKKQGFQLPENNPKFMGTFLHKILQQLSLHGRGWWENASIENKTQYCKTHLMQLGVPREALSIAVENIFMAIKNILSDPHGQWIIKPHLQAKNEWPLTGLIENEVKSLAIDRTFVDEMGIRWIIDYKTAALQDENRELFLDKAQSKYASQLTAYAKAIQKIDQRPIKLGLYFPLIPAWRSWTFS